MTFGAVLRDAHREFPSLRIIPQSESWVFRRLPGAWKRFTITMAVPGLGWRVYVPDSLFRDERGMNVTLRHELVHLRDAQRFTRLGFLFMYLFLLPFGLTLRSWLEYRAYCETVRATVDVYGFCDDYTIAAILRQFKCAAYGWMAPFFIRRIEAGLVRVRDEAQAARAGEK